LCELMSEEMRRGAGSVRDDLTLPAPMVTETIERTGRWLRLRLRSGARRRRGRCQRTQRTRADGLLCCV
jgi:hypothetical protein